MKFQDKFIVNIYSELKQVQLDLISNEEIRSFIGDNETNQESLSIKYFFCRFIIKVWTRLIFSQNKYVDYNQIIIKYCILYYRYCWKDRNEKLHDREIQRERVINWYKKEREIAKQSQYLQVQKYGEQNKVNIKASNTEYIRRQIYSL